MKISSKEVDKLDKRLEEIRKEKKGKRGGCIDGRNDGEWKRK